MRMTTKLSFFHPTAQSGNFPVQIATFHTRSPFSSFFSYEKGKLVLKFTTLDQVKPSIMSFVFCGSVCCVLLSTDQKPKWYYILSKRAIRSVLRKKTPKTSYIKGYLRTIMSTSKTLKKIKKVLKKEFAVLFCFLLLSSCRVQFENVF